MQLEKDTRTLDEVSQWYKDSWLKENNIKFLDWLTNHGKESNEQE